MEMKDVSIQDREKHNPEMIMLIGLPASGKSTYSEEMKEKGYEVHSFDVLREELYGDASEQKEAITIFQILHQRIITDLKQGKSCIYDATNMNRKRRVAFLRELKKISCYKKCVIFAIPVEVCKRRNQERERKVPNETYDVMLQAFQCPHKGEGWDEVEIMYSEESYKVPFDLMETFQQDNPHHTLTLGQHMNASYLYCKEHDFSWKVQMAARYHDCGKLYTKTFYNKKGEKVEHAHFYGNENYSAYLYVVDDASKQLCKEGKMEDVLYIANIIHMHMQPMNVWKQSEKSRKRDLELVGQELYDDILRFHEADREAH